MVKDVIVPIRSRPSSPPARHYREPSPRDVYTGAVAKRRDALPPLPAPAAQTPSPAPAPVSHAPPAKDQPFLLTYAAVALQGDPKGVAAYVTQGLQDNSLAKQIMETAAMGAATVLTQLLARPDVLPDFAGATGITPLMVAAARGHTEIVELLSKHPLVDVSRKGPEEWTALHFACALHNDACVSSLLTHHAAPDAATKNGNSPLDLAAGSSTENALWENRQFRRYIETVNRFHPKLSEVSAKKPKAPHL